MRAASIVNKAIVRFSRAFCKRQSDPEHLTMYSKWSRDNFFFSGAGVNLIKSGKFTVCKINVTSTDFQSKWRSDVATALKSTITLRSLPAEFIHSINLVP